MNVSSYLYDVSRQFTEVPPSSYPNILWNYYIKHLWNYQPNSWVTRITSACRVLAVLISLPIIVLALLDISSYGIARTLGIIDDVRASTSDITTIHQNARTPSIRIEASSPSGSTSPESPSDSSQTQPDSQNSLSALGASQPRAFYASDGDNLKLSGVGVFSPATSRPPSPVMTRKKLSEEARTSGLEQDDGLRQRGKQDLQDAE
ncbi:hypothetical protein LshimejAT787_0406280 [Lyophyllum shimeji]|uniref:Uncharacterized protein n=1 Tax=Lyophyllum shimeji TaxID=47721 RepID=A0A9P3PLP1_LYOSH|nr:hypothetical protein LshimejAT787_0406280 [Lyophyllum shimeji]